MTTLEISTDEWYPIYLLDQPRQKLRTDFIMEIPDELYAEYIRVMNEFVELQKKLEPYHQKGCVEQKKTYEKLFDEPRRNKLIIEEYGDDDEPSHCSKCDWKQKFGYYKGGTYYGCEQCAETEITKVSVWPTLYEATLGLRRLSSNTPEQAIRSTEDWSCPIIP